MFGVGGFAKCKWGESHFCGGDFSCRGRATRLEGCRGYGRGNEQEPFVGEANKHDFFFLGGVKTENA